MASFVKVVDKYSSSVVRVNVRAEMGVCACTMKRPHTILI